MCIGNGSFSKRDKQRLNLKDRKGAITVPFGFYIFKEELL